MSSSSSSCPKCSVKAANYGKPTVGKRVEPEQEKKITQPDGSDKSVEFKGMGVRGSGHPFEPVSYHPRPLGPLDVEIKISHCGICASDIHTVDAGWSDAENIHYPVIPGHEIVGVVTAVGSAAAAHHQIGDRVGVGAQVLSCLRTGTGAGACKECTEGNENHCPTGGVFTYNSKYPDGQYAFGGYADHVRVHSRFAFKLPDNIPNEVVAPLLCAGATVYAPLARYIKRPGMQVGVIGIGGLGHLAVQFAAKMGATVTAISSSDRKKDDALKLGATEYLNMSNPEERKKYSRRFDLIINSVTTTSADPATDYAHWLGLVTVGGYFVMVGIPDDHVRFSMFTIFGNRAHFTTSAIGSPAEIKEMLEFASKHGVRPWIDVRPLSKANDAVQELREGKPRFRLVLDTAQ